MESIRAANIPTLTNSGVHSQQLLFPENSASTRVTITRVTLASGVMNPPHVHETSEQIWIALEGAGTLLLADDETIAFSAGEVARFAEGDVHGFSNTGDTPFVYISVTTPPINFRAAYAQDWQKPDEK